MRSTLQGWKSVAAYFGRDERTVMRWAKDRGLPVRRLPGEGRSSVYALPEELAAWLSGGGAGNVAVADPRPVKEPELLHREAMPGFSAALADDESGRAQTFAPGHRMRWVAIAAALLILALGSWLLVDRDEGRAGPRSQASTDPVSERAYIQASYDLDNRTPESLARAVNEFGSAIAADPGNAKAYAGLGTVYLLLPEYTTASAAHAYPRAKAAADAAIALQPDIAAAHRVRAYVAFWSDGDSSAAQREFATALRLAPDDPVTHHWYATALSANGQQDRAVAEINRALALDPQSTSTMADSGLLLFVAGQRQEGLRRLRMVARSRPDQISAHQYLAALALVTGDDRTYLAEQAVANRLRNDPAADRLLAVARQGYAAGGHKGLLTALDGALTEQARRSGTGYFALARIAAAEGNAARAQGLLQTSFDRREPASVGARGEVAFQPLVAAGRLRIPGDETPL